MQFEIQFEEDIKKTVKNMIEKNMKMYIEEFASIIEEESLKNNGISKDAVIELWNGISKKYRVTDKSKKNSDSQDHCHHVFTKKGKEGETCSNKISEKSETGKYCSKHYKTDDHKIEEIPKTKCSAGLSNGKTCKNTVSKDSESGKYCNRHLLKEEDELTSNSGDETARLENEASKITPNTQKPRHSPEKTVVETDSKTNDTQLGKEVKKSPSKKPKRSPKKNSKKKDTESDSGGEVPVMPELSDEE